MLAEEAVFSRVIMCDSANNVMALCCPGMYIFAVQKRYFLALSHVNVLLGCIEYINAYINSFLIYGEDISNFGI